MTGRVASLADFARQYQVDPTDFYLLVRGLSVLASLSTIVLLYHVVRRQRDHRTALVASLFLGLSFLDVRHAHFAEVYSLLALFVLVATFFILTYVQHGRKQDLALAGMFCGAAIGLRYSMLPLVGTLLLGLLLRRRASDRKRSLVALSALLAGTMVLGFVIGAPAIVLNSRLFFKNIGVLAGLAGTQEGLWGFQFTDIPTWQFYATIIEIAFGLPLALMSLLGVAFAVWRHRRKDILLLSFPITYGVLLCRMSAASSAYARYMVPMLPFLAFFAADAAVTLPGWLVRRRSPRTRATVLSIVSLVLVAIPSYRIALLDHLWSQADTRTLAKDWIEANVPAGARIATQWHGPPLSTVNDPEPDTSRIYDVVVLDPFSADESLYQIDYYRREGFDYVILSSFIYSLARVNPRENDLRRSFYASLDQRAELVAEFRPYEGDIEPPFFFEQIWGGITDLTKYKRLGPTLKMYRLEH